MNRQMKEFCANKKKDPDYHTIIHYYNLLQPITILLGPNGTGKSTSIRTMIEETKNLDYMKVISYSTTNDDIVKRKNTPFKLDPTSLAASFLSEGERMDMSFFDWMDTVMLEAILKDRDKEILMLIDEADSGLSIDNIIKAFCQIKFIVNEEVKRGRKIKVAITCNSYELAEYFKDCDNAAYIWVPTNDYMVLGSYTRFKSHYLEYYKEMKPNGD